MFKQHGPIYQAAVKLIKEKIIAAEEYYQNIVDQSVSDFNYEIQQARITMENVQAVGKKVALDAIFK